MKQTTIPKALEEVAANLARLAREDQRYVAGVIDTLNATRQQRLTTDAKPGK
ncbi:MAG: hypothetical protein K2O18_14230 [Oscillospiraceae bacterium]|nr:hypothetical protein [Oscillospiraceae bacterium]